MSGQLLLKRESCLLLAAALMLGILFDFLFYGKALGISYPIFVLALYTIFFVSLRGKVPLRFRAGWFLTVPVFALALTFAVYSNQALRVLNFLAVPFLLVAHTILTAEGNSFKWYDLRFIGDIFEALFGRTLINIPAPFRVFNDPGKPGTDQGKYDVLKKIAVGLAVSAPILLVVILLLASADVVFGHYVGRIQELLRDFDLDEAVLRTILGLVVSILIFAYIYSFLTQKTGDPRKEPAPLTVKPWLDPVTAITMLIMINLIYILFTVIQFSYLFGGGNLALPEGYTYAEYARQGFFELLAVTVINFSIMIGMVTFVKKEKRLSAGAVRVLLNLLVAFTMVMLLSAYLRLSLYEQAYGYTYARILAHSIMIYLFFLFLIAVCKIWKEELSLLKVYIVISVIAYLALNYLNIDAVIAGNNIDRYFTTGKIDPYYLTILSDDAVPQVARLLNVEDEEIAAIIENHLFYRKEALSGKTALQSFNYSKYKAGQVLAGFDLQPVDLQREFDYAP